MLLTNRIDRNKIIIIQNKILEILKTNNLSNPLSLSKVFTLIPDVKPTMFLKAFWELCEQEAVMINSNKEVWT